MTKHGGLPLKKKKESSSSSGFTKKEEVPSDLKDVNIFKKEDRNVCRNHHGISPVQHREDPTRQDPCQSPTDLVRGHLSPVQHDRHYTIC